MHVEEAVLQRVMGQLTIGQLGSLGLLDALTEVAATMPDLFDVDGAGILLADENQVLRHFASTDPSAHLLEAVQESTGRGPCVQALVEDEVVATSDLSSDERWHGLAEVLVSNGVRSVLGAPVHVAGTPIGSINVYKAVPHQWDDSDRRALAAFDRMVERLLEVALVAERHEAVRHQLQEALRARVAIERAVGVVMVLEDVDAEAAFERIRRTARSSRRTVRQVAAEVTKYKKLG
jgi:GAF domain-containing protein